MADTYGAWPGFETCPIAFGREAFDSEVLDKWIVVFAFRVGVMPCRGAVCGSSESQPLS